MTSPDAHDARPFRFGVVAGESLDGPAWRELARKVEALGFCSLVIPDGPGVIANPFPMLTWAAAATSTLRVGTYVLNSDLRHPLDIARDAATLANLSGDRFELGLGAGRPGADANYHELGRTLDAPGARVRRFQQGVDVIRRLFGGEPVTQATDTWSVTDTALGPAFAGVQQPPLLLAGSGERMLRHAAEVAAIVALGMDPAATLDDARERVQIVHDAAVSADRDPELTINLAGVGESIHPWLRKRLDPHRDALLAAGAPALLLGSPSQMKEKLLRLRAELGITYITAPHDFVDDLAPVIRELV